MKKRYIIHDEDGKEFEVEETVSEAPIEEDVENTHDDIGALTDDEISALKKLASVADKIISLVSEEVHDEDEGDIEDEDIEEETEKEEVIDTDEDEDKTSKTCDSKKSFNSIETRKKTIDSIDDSEDVNAAWAKRYNRG